MPFADTDPASVWMGLAAVLTTLSGVWIVQRKSRREIAQGERIDALREWQAIHEQDRRELNELRERLVQVEAECRADRDRVRAEMGELHDYILLIKREMVAQHPEIRLTTLDEFRARRVK